MDIDKTWTKVWQKMDKTLTFVQKLSKFCHTPNSSGAPKCWLILAISYQEQLEAVQQRHFTLLLHARLDHLVNELLFFCLRRKVTLLSIFGRSYRFAFSGACERPWGAYDQWSSLRSPCINALQNLLFSSSHRIFCHIFISHSHQLIITFKSHHWSLSRLSYSFKQK